MFAGMPDRTTKRADAGGDGGGLWKAGQAARFLAISERHLWTLTQRGDVPAVRLGECIRYDPADLRAVIEARKTGRIANT